MALDPAREIAGDRGLDDRKSFFLERLVGADKKNAASGSTLITSSSPRTSKVCGGSSVGLDSRSQ
jgi:hypothetical protein